jgi:hypothetical protein
MRYAVVVIILSVAGSASAQSGAELCGRIGTQAELNECTALVAGRRVDANAVQLCGRIGTNREIVECARAVAGRSVSNEAVSLCSRIGTNREIVGCAWAVANHWQDAGAVAGCNRVGTNDGIVRCARAIADKQYAPEELELCGRNGSNDGIVQCMQSTGRRRGGYYAAQPAQSDEPPSSWFTITNRTQSTPLARLYVRPGDATQWGVSRITRMLYPGQSTTVRIPEGTWDICAEAPDGSSTFWNDLQANEGGNALSVDYGREYPDYWQVRRPCRNF